MSSVDKDELLERAKIEAQRWIDRFSLDGGRYNKDKIQAVLASRVFEGVPVRTEVAGSPDEAVMMLERLAKNPEVENLEAIDQAHLCLWDYYEMAFYESAYSVLPNKDKFPCRAFFDQTLLEAFEAGLGFLVNLGPYILGVMRPVVYRDENMQLHNEFGPAVIWGEGEYQEKQWWWHGVRVEQRHIESKETIDPEEAWGHKNAEVRRALCEIVGWEKIMDAVGAKVIHEDETGQLLEAENVIDGERIKLRFVRVTCPTTNRVYVLGTRETAQTAKEGVAATFGMTPEEYNPVVET